MKKVYDHPIIEIKAGEETTENHGNTRLPFGLCARYGIDLPDGATPRDAWNALKGRGITPENVYDHLKNESLKELKPPENIVVKADDTKKSSYKYNEKVAEKFDSFCETNRQIKHETALVVGEDGEKILEKGGNSSSVSFSYFERINFKGARMIHNHPQNYTFLSGADLDALVTMNLRSIEAVGWDGTRCVFAPKNYMEDPSKFNNPTMDEVLKYREYKNNLNKFIIGYEKAISEGSDYAEKKWREAIDKNGSHLEKSGKYHVIIANGYNSYRPGASPRDRMNYTEFAKDIQTYVKKYLDDNIDNQYVACTIKDGETK